MSEEDFDKVIDVNLKVSFTSHSNWNLSIITCTLGSFFDDTIICNFTK